MLLSHAADGTRILNFYRLPISVPLHAGKFWFDNLGAYAEK